MARPGAAGPFKTLLKGNRRPRPALASNYGNGLDIGKKSPCTRSAKQWSVARPRCSHCAVMAGFHSSSVRGHSLPGKRSPRK